MYNKQVDETIKNKRVTKQDDIDYHNVTLFHEDGSTTVYPECHELTSGGSKKIIKLNNEYVIASVGNHENTRPYIQSEVNFSNELRKIGLRAQYYQAVEIKVDNDDTLIPALKMHSFQFLAKNGQQVRDQKNSSSSAGDSFIFASKDNLVSEAHWRKIMAPLVNDMYIYLINGLTFPGDSWNAVIEDTSETSAKKEQQDSLLITDRAQEIHFYFFDFGNSIINPASFKTKYNFLDIEGRISEEHIIRQVNSMKNMVLSLIVHTCPKWQEYNDIIFPNKSLYEPVFEKIWPEITKLVVQKIQTQLEGMSEDERLDSFTSDSKENILYFRQLRLDRENTLQQIKKMEEEHLQKREEAIREESLKTQKEEEKNKKIDVLMEKIDSILDDLLSKIDSIEHHLQEAKIASSQLYLELKEARSAYKGYLKTDKDENEQQISPSEAWILFKTQCGRAINKARPVLERDLCWGDYLQNILKIIANSVINAFTGSGNNFFKPVRSESSITALAAGKALQSGELRLGAT